MKWKRTKINMNAQILQFCCIKVPWQSFFFRKKNDRKVIVFCKYTGTTSLFSFQDQNFPIRACRFIFLGLRFIPARLYFFRAGYFALIFCFQINAKSFKGRNGLVSSRLRYRRGWITLHVYTAALWNPVVQRGSFRECITHHCHGQSVAGTGSRARHCAKKKKKKLNRTKF